MEEDRYNRQLQCTAGFRQTALSDAVVLIAGMGGLGTSASTAVTAARVRLELPVRWLLEQRLK